MRALPQEFETGALIGLLADGWGFEVGDIHYAAVGGGSYHWVVVDAVNRTRGFATVDDLDQKPWLGDTRDSVFDGLRRAFDTAAALRDRGLGFVVAPIPTRHGETVRRVGPRHTIALFPFVDGLAGRFGHYDSADTRAAIVTMLAELHTATPAVSSIARRFALELPGRHHLAAALQEVNQTWLGGPLSEPARHALASGASEVAAQLAVGDRLSSEVASRCTNW